MKIIFESDERLCLRDQPWIVLVALGLLCALFSYAIWRGDIPGQDFPWPFVVMPFIALAAFLYYFERLEVIFDRNTGSVRLIRKRLLRTFETRHELSAATNVGIIGTGDIDGGTHRIALYFEDVAKPVPLTFYETNQVSVSDARDRIEAWLERQTL
ncbi:hypothetical protein [Yoonia sp. SS1-5]|uniref:Uncharacterized protein n=1 Tax=Yoonia rhodophyticola TaxID=3137370 RepID=A0AAN0NJ28_9RHOB